MFLKTIRVAVLLIPAFIAITADASPWSDAIKAKVDATMAKNFSNRTQVGVVVGVIHGDASFVWSYGERVYGTSEAPTGKTFLEIGSITKTYTCTLLALEVIRGRVRLEDRVHTLWPELKGTDAGEITLEQLATHTSGLPRMPDNFEPSDPLNPYHDYDEQRLTAFLKRFKQVDLGPHSHSYSNLGMGLLGLLLSKKLNHLDYATYLKSDLTTPLGLNDTRVSLAPDDYVRAAQGYNGFFGLMPFWNLNVLEPAGVLKTTAEDLLKYTQFNMHPNSSLIGQAAILAQTPRIPADGKEVMIGLGWFSTRIGDHSVITHGGATGGYRAQLILDKQNALGVVVLSNTDIAPSCVASTIFDVECTVPEWKAIDSKTQQQLFGTYRSDSLGLTLNIFTENGILGLQQDSYRMRLFAKSDTEFTVPDAEATIQFKLDEQGRATQFTLFQNGGAFDFVRTVR